MLGSTVSVLTKLSVLILLSCLFANSDQNVDNFLQCLPCHSDPSHPISQAVYTPENSSFSSVLNAYAQAKRFMTPTTPKPVAIVTALHESHLQASIICANDHGLQLRIRSGGHDFEGLSYVSQVPFVILDMFNLRSIEIDVASETAWVQAGAMTGELYYRIAEKSNILAFPSGVCTTLGTGGHFSGGGYGNLMRKYGLSVDHVIDALLYDAQGNILDRNSMGEDAFWAIKGGGGASFGVILAWKIKLVRVPEIVTVFEVWKTIEQGATDIIHRWQHVAPRLPQELFIRAMPQVINGDDEGKKSIAVAFIGQFLGKPVELLSIVEESFPELGLQEEDCIPTSWVNSTLFWANFPIGTAIDVLLNRTISASFYKGKSDYVKTAMEKSTIEAIWKKMLEVGNMWMQWNPYGGKMSEVPEKATPFPHRAGNLFLLHYYTFWNHEKETDHYLNASRSFYQFMTPHVSESPREAYLNYRDLDIGSNPSDETSFETAKVYGSKYFKDNFDRLVRAKSKVDPNNFFRNEQSIPTWPSVRTKVELLRSTA